MNLTPYCGLIVGLVITVLAGLGVGPAIEMINANFVKQVKKLDLPAEFRDRFAAIAGRRPGGGWVGHVERLIFFASLWQDAWLIIASWLVFKVAANWTGPSQINAQPKWMVDHENLSVFQARQIWASRASVSFLFGTGASLLIAMLGVAIGKWL